MPRTGYYSLALTHDRVARIAAICGYLDIDPTERGALGKAIDLALLLAARSPLMVDTMGPLVPQDEEEPGL